MTTIYDSCTYEATIFAILCLIVFTFRTNYLGTGSSLKKKITREVAKKKKLTIQEE